MQGLDCNINVKQRTGDIFNNLTQGGFLLVDLTSDLGLIISYELSILWLRKILNPHLAEVLALRGLDMTDAMLVIHININEEEEHRQAHMHLADA